MARPYFTRPEHIFVVNPEDPPEAQNRMYYRKWTGEERARVMSLALQPLEGEMGVKPDPKAKQRYFLDLPRQSIEMAKATIVRWDGPDFAGVECTPEAIGMLDPDILDLILPSLMDLNGGLTEEAKKKFETPTNGHTSETVQLPSPARTRR